MKGRFFSKENGSPGHRHGHRANNSDTDSSFLTTGSSSQDYNPFYNLDAASINDNYPPSPFENSPWSSQVNIEIDHQNPDQDHDHEQEGRRVRDYSPYLLLGSLVREEGHIYSLAASNDLIYTGSDSKNIRVWKNQKEFAGFKSNSGLVKAIVIANNKIFTGHQDGKIRIWKISSKNPSNYKRVGTLPKFTDFVKSSMRPSNYVEVRRHKNMVWLKHFDAISCLTLNEDQSLLYSSSWDKTFKVWRISDYKCLESVTAHDDAVNSIVAGFDGLVFTGSADGTVKVWRRETQGKGTKHFFSQTLLKQECAVTALVLNRDATVIYSGSSDGFVNLWERQNHLAHGGVLKGHKLAVLCLTTAGSLVISGSADMGICVWRRLGSDHIWLSFLTGHSGPVKCLAAQKEGETISGERWILYSGSLDKSMKIWQILENAPPTAWNGCESSMPVFLPPNRNN